MNSMQRPPVNPRTAGRPPDDVDGLLRAYFRVAMPRPWPALMPPAHDGLPSSPRANPPRFHLHSRFALAAAVALFVIGYASLASRFPAAPSDPGIGAELPRTLGNKLPRHPLPRSGQAVERTRNGGEALLQWEELPGGLFMNIEEKRPPRR